MLLYRGDKFVKGKKFRINENDYIFIKRNKEDKLCFESICDGKYLVIDEEKYNKLEEKVNQENKEINELIGKALRSKATAREIEDKLKSYGITVDYDKGQGVSLIGPNGKRLSASTKEVYGPSRPGFNDTHKKTDNWYISTAYKKSLANEKENLAKLKAMDRDDIIRKYNDKTTEEALAAHKEDIARSEKRIANYEKSVEEYESEIKYDNDKNRRLKRAGHIVSISGDDSTMPKDKANSTVDYLTYLTKNNNYDRKNYRQSYIAGDYKNSNGNYTGRNGMPNETQRSETLKKYDRLKRDIEYSKNYVNNMTYDKDKSYNSYYAAMSDEDLEAKIQSMRDNLEKEIEKLRKDNQSNKDSKQDAINDLKKKEKELEDFLKSKGVRESVSKIIISKVLTEGASDTYNKAYYSSQLYEIYDSILTLAQEAAHDGYADLSKSLDNILSLLDNISI